MSKTAKFKSQPLISILAGYQRFVGRDGSERPFSTSTRKGRTRRIPIYRVNGKTKFTSYVGNHIIAQVYKPIENITKKEEQDSATNFVNQTKNLTSSIISKIARRYTNKKTYDKIQVVTGGSGSPEEQVLAVGGTPTKHGGAEHQPVDIKAPFGNFEVTTQRLDKVGHHGIYGDQGDRLAKDISSIRERYAGLPHKEVDMHYDIAYEGYQYFRDRIRRFNKGLEALQKSHTDKGKLMSPSALRSKVNSIPTAVKGASADLANITSGFAQRAGREFVAHAIGNFPDFRNGVSYTFPIDPYAHAVIQKFMMKRNSKGAIIYDESALSRNKTEVLYSYMATDELFKAYNAGYTNEDVAARRFFAAISARANKDVTTTSIGQLTKVNTGINTLNAKTYTPSIDLLNANSDMARHIKNVLLPKISEGLRKDSKSYIKTQLGDSIDVTGSVLRQGRKAKIWAAPYLGVADYGFEAFGDGETLPKTRKLY